MTFSRDINFIHQNIIRDLLNQVTKFKVCSTKHTVSLTLNLRLKKEFPFHLIFQSRVCGMKKNSSNGAVPKSTLFRESLVRRFLEIPREFVRSRPLPTLSAALFFSRSLIYLGLADSARKLLLSS